MNWKRIVVGVDFSPESELALEQGIAIARRTGAELLMLHAAEIVEVDADPETKEMYSERQHAAHEHLSEWREQHHGSGVVISHALHDGKPAAALVSAAEEVDASLLVVGTHGRTGLRRFLLGSVAEKVVRHATGDVLVVRPGARRTKFGRILVATDFSDAAEHALSVAVEIADDDAEIDLVHYWQLPMPITAHYLPYAARSATYDRIAREIEATAKSRADQLLGRYRNDRVAIDADIVHGPPAAGIVDRGAGYDLIAIGRRGMSALERVLVGSVADRTVRHAPCSVLVGKS